MEAIANTRQALRSAIRSELRERLDDVVQHADGTWNDVPCVTEADLADVIAEVFGADLPPATNQAAEVATPAVVLVWATCPKCQLPASIAIRITPELRIGETGSTLRVQGKSKPVFHVCGQTVLPLETEGQTELPLEEPGSDAGEADVVEVTEADLAAAKEPARGDPVEIDGVRYRLVETLTDGTRALREIRKGGGAGSMRNIDPVPLAWDGERWAIATANGNASPTSTDEAMADRVIRFLDQARGIDPRDEDVPTCRICGCTDERACEGGCSWVVDPIGLGDLCSRCLPQVEAEGAPF